MKKIFILSMFLFVLFFSISINLTSMNHNQVDESIRTIENVNIDNETKIINLVDEFLEANYSLEGNELSFDGSLKWSKDDLNNYVFSSLDVDNLEKKVSTKYNFATNEFIMNIEYYDGNLLIDEISGVATPYYDELEDEGYIIFEDEKYLISEYLDIDNVDECIAIVDDLTIGAVVAVAFAITIVATSPSVNQAISTAIQTVVETVVEAVKSFFGWFASWIKRVFTRTTTKTVTIVTTTYSPSLSIDGVKYNTKAVSKAELEKETSKNSNSYYLAFASGISKTKEIHDGSLDSDGLFLGPKVTKESAIAILINPTYVTSYYDGNEFSYVASIFSYYQSNITELLNEPYVGYSSSTPITKPERHDGGLYHYHPGDEYYVYVPYNTSVKGSNSTKAFRPHAFFLNLDITPYLYY